MQLNVSLFEEICLLIDPTEMKDFLEMIPSHFFVDASAPLNGPEPNRVEFLRAYKEYVESIINGDYRDPKGLFHARMVLDPECIEFQQVKGGKWITFFLRPPIYLKHTTAVVADDKSWKLHVFGKDRLFLGVTFQYPRIYEGKDRIAKKTIGLKEFCAFRVLSGWAKKNTFPLRYKGKPVGVRVTEKSLSWLKNSAQLKNYFVSGDLS
jgi:hypothetical protein